MRHSLIGSLTVVLCVTGIALGLWSLSRGGPENLEPFVSDVGIDTLAAIDSGAAASDLGSERPVYAYSVIPGGAYSASELRHAIATDPIVAAHYQNLDQSKLQVRSVARDQYAYVSYRKGDKVFWTKNKVLLRQGETIVTEGTKQVRGRCGNCISEAPQLPTAADEPESVEFDRLVDEPKAQPARPDVALVPLAYASDPGITTAAESLAEALSPYSAGRFPAGVSGPFVSGGNGTNVPASPSDDPNQETPVPPFVPEPPIVFPLPPGLFPTPPTAIPTPPGDLPPTDNNPPFVPESPINPPQSEPVTPVAVPEPGTLILLAAGAATLMRRRRSSSR